MKQDFEHMFKRHKIGEASVAERKLVLVFGSLLAITLLLFAAWAVTLFINTAAVDDCLDQGGSYDYEQGSCDFEVNHSKP
jgi:hypothetical protein